MKIKNIISFILKFFLSILIILLTSIIILKSTILNKEYIKEVLEKENYYEKLSNSTKEEMKNYLIQSGFTEEIIEDIYTTNDIKNDVNRLIDQVYSNSEITINTDKIKTNLENNITSYLEEKNIEFSNSDELDRFVLLIADIYEEEVGITNYLNILQKVYLSVSEFIMPIIITLVALTFILITILLLLKSKYILSVPLLTLTFTYLIISFYLKDKIAIDNLLILSQDISNLIKYIFLDIIGKINTISLISFAIAIIFIILRRSHDKNN